MPSTIQLLLIFFLCAMLILFVTLHIVEKDRKQKSEGIDVSMAPEGIRFDAGLIGRLKDDHQKLIGIFMEINHAVDSDRFDLIPVLLGQFNHALHDHVIVENIKFYMYLQNKFLYDGVESAHLSGVRREMNGIARAVVKFVNLYSASPPTQETAAIFKRDLSGIGEVLVRRVDLEEESLYPMYSEA